MTGNKKIEPVDLFAVLICYFSFISVVKLSFQCETDLREEFDYFSKTKTDVNTQNESNNSIANQ